MTPLGDLARTSVTVDVPASTANLGAGFDCLALALDIANRITVSALEDQPGVIELEVVGEGAGRLPASPSNRFVRALELGLREGGGAAGPSGPSGPSGARGSQGPAGPPGVGWRILMENDIPLSRGLGSSASVTVGGLVAADALLGGGRLDPRRTLELASALEGHPDNAAAALHGGFTVVGSVDGRPEAVRFDPPVRLLTVLFIPDRPLATAQMRAVLPRSVPFVDAVHNVGAAALAVAAMTSGRLDLLWAATDDHLHEPYRARIYPELPMLTRAARDAGALGACLSGAGSTIIAFVDEGTAEAVGQALRDAAARADLAGSTRVVRPRTEGALVEAGA